MDDIRNTNIYRAFKNEMLFMDDFSDFINNANCKPQIPSGSQLAEMLERSRERAKCRGIKET